MSRFDFNNSRYAAFFRSGEGQQILRDYIDNSGMININYNWWRNQFAVNPEVTPTDSSGKASFMVQASENRAAGVLDMRAPLGKAHPYKKEGISFYTGTIPDFTSDAIAETAMERMYKEKYFAEFGNDAKFIREWTKRVQDLIDAKDQTANYMCAQLQTEGYVKYDIGRGIKGIKQKAAIPEENFVKAGEKVWTVPDAKLFSQMAIIEDGFRQRTGFTGAMKWLIPKKMYSDVFLHNAEVKQWINYLRNLNTNSPMEAPDIPVVLKKQFDDAVAAFDGLSPIEIVVEKEKNKDWKGDTTVNGWAANVAVLRPVGYAGLIMHTTSLDQEMANMAGNNVVSQAFAPIDGFSLIHNAEMVDGEYKSWNTRLITSFIPALTEFPEHIIVDTATADS